MENFVSVLGDELFDNNLVQIWVINWDFIDACRLQPSLSPFLDIFAFAVAIGCKSNSLDEIF